MVLRLFSPSVPLYKGEDERLVRDMVSWVAPFTEGARIQLPPPFLERGVGGISLFS